MPNLLLADRVKSRSDTFLAPLIPALERRFNTRFISAPPGPELSEAINWADLVWLEWCWDHAVWATRSGVLGGRPCILRLHSIEALQTRYPAQVDWSQVTRLVTVGHDITEVLLSTQPTLAAVVQPEVIPNGIDMNRFRPGQPDPKRIAWVGHVEPKKNPMLLLQVLRRLEDAAPGYTCNVAGAFTDCRTHRYLMRMVEALGLSHVIRFDGQVSDMPAWYADKGVLISTSMYESFGMNIGEAMAVGAFPVVHDFPLADRLWPRECLFAGIDEAVALIRGAHTGAYREWVGARYGLDRQIAATMRLLQELAADAALNV